VIFDTSPADRKVRQFSLSSTFLDQYKGQQPNWGFGGLGYFTYKRTYARTLPTGGTEEWWQTCKRVVEGVYNTQKVHCAGLHLDWQEPKAQKSAQEMFRRMWDFKFLPPGRGLWMMGTEVVNERGAAALNNCGFASTEDIDVDFPGPFCFLMDMSMLGVGVGGDTRGVGKVRIGVPTLTDKPCVVEDSRQGWVEVIRAILYSFVYKPASESAKRRWKFPQVIDFSQVRKRGAELKTFGGTSSGPRPLIELIENLTKLLMPEGVELSFSDWDADDPEGPFLTTTFSKTEGSKPYRINSTQIVDIFNFIGKAVVAGGIRRTAEIMFGDPNDQDFVTLKQDQAALEDRRWASNNSIWGKVGMDYDQVAEAIAANGEPGIIWMENVRKFSRMNGEVDNKDKRAKGANPCVEQSLEDRELCCLVETFPAHHDSLDDYRKTLKMAYLYAKTVTLIPTHNPRTNTVLMRNRRIGCSMSGIQQAKKKLGRRAFLGWCEEGYDYIQALDNQYSEWLCVRPSIKTTSVKPSGTVSLLAGSTPGIHYPHSEFYIRNIRVKNTSPLVDAARTAGYMVEADVYADDTSVISFPVHEKNFSKGKRDASIWEQFADAAAMQKHWADNQVSCTVTFAKAEASQIARCLEVYEDQLKAISLLPLDDHGYKQAPYIEIDEATYDTLMGRITTLDLSDSAHDDDATEKFCDGDSCVIDFSKS
jgi:ribonucleotide reductase alpha subunit